MSDGREKRVARDTQMVSMGRAIEDFYGPDGIEALTDMRRKKAVEAWRKRAEEVGRRDPGYLLCLFSTDAHEYEVVRNDETCLEVKVTRCVHADTFRRFNAGDLGEKLICRGDDAVVEGYNPRMRLRRPSLLMDGGPCCHFIFDLPEGGEEGET